VRFSPGTMMVALVLTNLVNYVDRGIVPGAADAFLAFIASSRRPGSLGPNAYFGALQSAFVVGFSAGSVAVGSLVHRAPPFGLAACGLSAWIVAACVAGGSRYVGSYFLLLAARACSGVGEAGFVTVGGPYIQDVAGEHQGAWLGVFYAMIPAGTAIGYGYGVAVAEALTWSWAFFFEAVAMAPLALCFALSADDGSSAFEADEADEDDDSVDLDHFRGALGLDPVPEAAPPPPPTLWAEVKLCFSQPCFVWVALGYAGYAGSIIGFSTFGPSILVGLGLWSSMAAASLAFSATVAASGFLGTPLGGLALDAWAKRSPRSRLAAALELSLLLVTAGGLFVASAAFATDKSTFLVRLFLGTLPLFAATAPMNVAVYESVPRSNRALGSALGTLLMHALGDVPTPILFGAAKDALAPDCTPRGERDALGDDCPRQRKNLRLVALAAAAWLIFSLLGFAIAYLKARLAAARLAARDRDHLDASRRRARSASPPPRLPLPDSSQYHPLHAPRFVLPGGPTPPPPPPPQQQQADGDDDDDASASSSRDSLDRPVASLPPPGTHLRLAAPRRTASGSPPPSTMRRSSRRASSDCSSY